VGLFFLTFFGRRIVVETFFGVACVFFFFWFCFTGVEDFSAGTREFLALFFFFLLRGAAGLGFFCWLLVCFWPLEDRRVDCSGTASFLERTGWTGSIGKGGQRGVIWVASLSSGLVAKGKTVWVRACGGRKLVSGCVLLCLLDVDFVQLETEAGRIENCDVRGSPH